MGFDCPQLAEVLRFMRSMPGWSLATSMIVAAPFMIVLRPNRDAVNGGPRWSRGRDYSTGIFASVLAHGLGSSCLFVAEDIIGSMDRKPRDTTFVRVCCVDRLVRGVRYEKESR